METQSNAAAIPVLADLNFLQVAPQFSAFKAEDRISFIRKYDPAVTETPEYRHAVIRYRNTDTKVVQKVAQMVTVPQLKLPEEFSLLPEKAIKVLMGVFEDEQDSMIRSMIERGDSYIGWDNLALDKVLDSLTAIRLSQRLTKEGIEAWFKIACLEVCTIRGKQIAEAKSYNPEQTAKQVAGTLDAYCALAMKLAAPVPNLGTQEATAIKNLLVVGKLADDMSKVLLAKLDAMLNPKVVENINL